MEFTITSTSRLEAQAPTVALALGGIEVGGRAAGVAATVEIEASGAPEGVKARLGVSRLEGETEWIVDSFAHSNGYVLFSNGVGARYCKLKTISDERIVRALDNAAQGYEEGS